MSRFLSAALLLASTLGASATLSGCFYEEHCEILPAADFEAPPELRNPYTGECQSFGGGGGGGGGTSCDEYGGAEPTPALEEDRAPLPDWGICFGFCEELSEEDCLAASECRGAYLSDCPPNAACEDESPEFYQCWSTSTGTPILGDCSTFDADECARHNECYAVHDGAFGELGPFLYCAEEDPEPIDPGNCTDEVLCDAEPPACPENTVPGRRDGCWTGFCIPQEQCDALPACAQMGEQECIARADCSPVYEGIDCSCDGESCTCADWLFERCE